MNVAGIGSFVGGLAGSFQEAQNARARNMYYEGMGAHAKALADYTAGPQSAEAQARAGGLSGEEARKQMEFDRDTDLALQMHQFLANKYGKDGAARMQLGAYMKSKFGADHPMTQAVMQGITPTGGAVAPPTGDADESNSALPQNKQGSDSPNAGGQVMP